MTPKAQISFCLLRLKFEKKNNNNIVDTIIRLLKILKI